MHDAPIYLNRRIIREIKEEELARKHIAGIDISSAY